MSIPYYNEVHLPNGSILSCDNLRINFSVNPHYRDEFEQIFSSLIRTDIKRFPDCLSDFKFKYLWQVSYTTTDLETYLLTCGYIFNGSKGADDIKKGYLDFNPNKLGQFEQFWKDLRHIKSCCETWEIARCDIALDIRTKRENVILEKDNRKYSLDAYSFSNKTEYLGRRSNIGFVKVYNKTIESKLDYDLTRIEITCALSLESFVNSFPNIYDISQGGQFDFEIINLKDTDLSILRMELELLRNGLDNGLMIFNSMSLYKKQKLKKFLLPESCLVSCSLPYVSQLMKSTEALYC